MFAILRWKYSWFSLNQNTSDTEIDVFPCYADLGSISLFCSLGVYVDFEISTFNFSASLYYYENGIILLLKRLIFFFGPKYSNWHVVQSYFWCSSHASIITKKLLVMISVFTVWALLLKHACIFLVYFIFCLGMLSFAGDMF